MEQAWKVYFEITQRKKNLNLFFKNSYVQNQDLLQYKQISRHFNFIMGGYLIIKTSKRKRKLMLIQNKEESENNVHESQPNESLWMF